MKTVGDYIKRLQEFPIDWEVKVATQAGGGISIEHREIKGNPVIAIFGTNGGRFGENPLNDNEYKKKSEEFLLLTETGMYSYTSNYGDHRLVRIGSDGCYGHRYDRRIIERMIEEGIIYIDEKSINKVRYLEGIAQ